ncbi:MAG TPA: hypothetical protein VLG12_05235 [Candidatus Saccharimonadales bacterium]|nr:hypothetical protein [Candidatus Saccharimonadales bacterium]
MRIKIEKLIWDDWNIAHIARHDIIPEEVEYICKANPQVEEANKGRIRVTSTTEKGRIVSAFLDPESDEGVYYPVSARDASKKEKKQYKEWQGVNKQ